MKTLEFLYQETKIHFLVNPSDNNVMVNATEMAKIFNNDVREFLKLKSTKDYIEAKLKSLNNEGNHHHYIEEDLVRTNKKAGTLMLRPLALKFAAWLNADFEVWVFDTIDNVVFGNYKKHWEAHIAQEDARKQMELLKKQLLTNPTQEAAIKYFNQEENFLAAKKAKRSAIANQMKMDF